MSVQVLDADDVRRIAREELARPEYVTQRTAPGIVGIPSREFLRLSHANAWRWTKERRLIVARTGDVLEYFERRLTVAAAAPANDADAETIALSRVGARRVDAR